MTDEGRGEASLRGRLEQEHVAVPGVAEQPAPGTEDALIGGVAGRSAEGTLSAGASIDTVEGAYRVVDYLPLLPRHRFRLAVIVVDGQHVLIAAVANATDFVVFGPVAAGIIATIEFPAP